MFDSVNRFLRTCNITARRRYSTAWVFDQRTGHCINAHAYRLLFLCKLAITIIYKNHRMRVLCMYKICQECNFMNMQAPTPCIASTSLNSNHCNGIILF